MLPAARAGLFLDPDLHPAVLRTAGVGIVAGDRGHVGEGQQALSGHTYAQTLELLPDPRRARREARVELPAAVGVCKSCDVVASPGYGRRLQIAGKARVGEDQSFNTALGCAASSDGCKVAVCFQPYLDLPDAAG